MNKTNRILKRKKNITCLTDEKYPAIIRNFSEISEKCWNSYMIFMSISLGALSIVISIDDLNIFLGGDLKTELYYYNIAMNVKILMIAIPIIVIFSYVFFLRNHIALKEISQKIIENEKFMLPNKEYIIREDIKVLVPSYSAARLLLGIGNFADHIKFGILAYILPIIVVFYVFIRLGFSFFSDKGYNIFISVFIVLSFASTVYVSKKFLFDVMNFKKRIVLPVFLAIILMLIYYLGISLMYIKGYYDLTYINNKASAIKLHSIPILSNRIIKFSENSKSKYTIVNKEFYYLNFSDSHLEGLKMKNSEFNKSNFDNTYIKGLETEGSKPFSNTSFNNSYLEDIKININKNKFDIHICKIPYCKEIDKEYLKKEEVQKIKNVKNINNIIIEDKEKITRNHRVGNNILIIGTPARRMVLKNLKVNNIEIDCKEKNKIIISNLRIERVKFKENGKIIIKNCIIFNLIATDNNKSKVYLNESEIYLSRIMAEYLYLEKSKVILSNVFVKGKIYIKGCENYILASGVKSMGVKSINISINDCRALSSEIQKKQRENENNQKNRENNQKNLIAENSILSQKICEKSNHKNVYCFEHDNNTGNNTEKDKSRIKNIIKAMSEKFDRVYYEYRKHIEISDEYIYKSIFEGESKEDSQDAAFDLSKDFTYFVCESAVLRAAAKKMKEEFLFSCEGYTKMIDPTPTIKDKNSSTKK